MDNIREVYRKLADSKKEWVQIHSYLETIPDVSKKLCMGCKRSKLYDKNRKEYEIRQGITFEQVTRLIKLIRTINAA